MRVLPRLTHSPANETFIVLVDMVASARLATPTSEVGREQRVPPAHAQAVGAPGLVQSGDGER